MGRPLIQMASVFGEQEREIIRSRVRAGLRPCVPAGEEARPPQGGAETGEVVIWEHLSAGYGIFKVAALVGVGSGSAAASEAGMVGDGEGDGPRRDRLGQSKRGQLWRSASDDRLTAARRIRHGGDVHHPRPHTIPLNRRSLVCPDSFIPKDRVLAVYPRFPALQTVRPLGSRLARQG